MRIVCGTLLALSLSFAALFGQSTQTGFIDSSYPVTIPAGSSLSISTVSLTVSYPTGLTPGSYISGTQLNTDFQSFLAAYPSPTDPPEAILSTVLQNILNKYPQMVGGTMLGEINGSQNIGGISIPVPGSGGTITVVIGNFAAAEGGLVRHPAKPKPVPSHLVQHGPPQIGSQLLSPDPPSIH